MDSKKAITIYDIAQELNISPSTVSRALKGHYSIGRETIKAVKKLADKRGYRPNSIAASLRSKKTNNIGVVISWINRPFMSSLISGIEMEANQKGYNVVITQSHDSFEKEVANAQALFDSRVGGLVVSLAMETKKYDHFKQFMKNDIPVVFVDRVTDALNCDLVLIDNHNAAYEATKHLIEQGCKKIAHVGGVLSRNIYNDRQRGYIDALKKHGIPIDDNYIIESDKLSADEGTRTAEYLLNLAEPPDGIFVANDTAAVSIIQYAKSKGIKIPQELAIIGFNNDPISLIVEPALSSVSHPAVEMGQIAAQQVLRKKDNKEIVKSQSIILKTEVLVRESSNRNS